jgi:hypothetical protein
VFEASQFIRICWTILVQKGPEVLLLLPLDLSQRCINGLMMSVANPREPRFAPMHCASLTFRSLCLLRRLDHMRMVGDLVTRRTGGCWEGTVSGPWFLSKLCGPWPVSIAGL